MLRCPIVVIATAIIASTSALAQSPPNSAAPSQPTASPDAAAQQAKEVEVVAKRLCKAEPVVGTRLAKRRRCNTPAELAAFQAQAREFIESWRRRPCMQGAAGGENQTLPC